jgi:hypothetical protein
MQFEDDKRFEEELKRAFRAEDPGDAFTRRVLNRVTVETARPTPTTRLSWRVVLPFAASLAIAVGGAAWLQHALYVEDGERARAQVLTALRLTSEKLNVVRSAVIEAQEPH